MKVAVTGASGHIGNCLVRELKKKGARIKVLVHHFKNDLEEMGVEIVRGDLLNPESLDELCEGVDVVFHLAARIAIDHRWPELVYATNVTGTENIVKAAKRAGVKKLIHFSSIDAFQTQPQNKVLDEDRPLVDSGNLVYGFTKAQSERVVMEAVSEGLNAVILSPTAVIGPFDFRGSYLGQALRKIYRRKLPLLVAGGYNWVDVRDVVHAALAAIEPGGKGEKYILGGTYCSLQQLAKMTSKLSGEKVPRTVPVSVARLACPFFQIYSAVTKKEPLYTNRSLGILVNSPRNVSSEKAKAALNYSPRPLEQTLYDTFNWYKEAGLL